MTNPYPQWPSAVDTPQLPIGPITGVNTRQSLVPGPFVAPGDAGAPPPLTWEFDFWGELTTTALADTFRFRCLWSNPLLGTSLYNSGLVQPSTTGLVSGVPWRFAGKVQFRDTVTACVSARVYTNFFLNTAGEQVTTIATAPAAQQLFLTVSPSIVGESITVQAGSWRQYR